MRPHRVLSCASLAVFAVSCIAPTQPTGSTTDPGGPKIACPIPPPPAQAVDATGAFVPYGAASFTLGTPPVTGPACTPASGSKFPIGTTKVTCTISDAKARTDSCSFSVIVQSPPRLTVTRFVAFGDSMTAGEIVSQGVVVSGGVFVRPLQVDPVLAYPAHLYRALVIRYQTQQPFVTNNGKPGETTAQGVARLPLEISAANQPQVLLLLEGANDLPGGNPASVAPALLNMQGMVRIGKGRGLRVFVGTLPPQNPNACSGPNVPPGCVFRAGGARLVSSYNEGLKQMAAAENVPLVDVHQAFHGDVTSLLDFDGLHPTVAGYQVIADAFFVSITQTLEVPPAMTTAPTLAPRAFFAPPWNH